MRHFLATVAAGLFLAAGPIAEEWTLKVEPIETPAGAESGQPQLTVSKRGVLLSWIERKGPHTTLRFAERTAGGWTQRRDAILNI